jgi:hypothetical protein
MVIAGSFILLLIIFIIVWCARAIFRKILLKKHLMMVSSISDDTKSTERLITDSFLRHRKREYKKNIGLWGHEKAIDISQEQTTRLIKTLRELNYNDNYITFFEKSQKQWFQFDKKILERKNKGIS